MLGTVTRRAWHINTRYIIKAVDLLCDGQFPIGNNYSKAIFVMLVTKI